MFNQFTVKDALERAYANLQKDGWWGIDKDRNIKYNRVADDARNHCKCAGLHIADACRELGVDEDATQNAFLSVLGTLPAPRHGNRTPFRSVAAWNDVPSRHVATVKRAFVRAIAKAA